MTLPLPDGFVHIPRNFVQQCRNEGLGTREIIERIRAAGNYAAVSGDLVIAASTHFVACARMDLALQRPENAAYSNSKVRVFGPAPSKA